MIDGQLTYQDHALHENAESRQEEPTAFAAVLSSFIVVALLAIMLGLGASILVERYGITPEIAAPE